MIKITAVRVLSIKIGSITASHMNYCIMQKHMGGMLNMFFALVFCIQNTISKSSIVCAYVHNLFFKKYKFADLWLRLGLIGQITSVLSNQSSYFK